VSPRLRRLASSALALALSSVSLGASAFVWPNVPEQIDRALTSGDVADRRVAAQRIAELPPEIGVPLAARAMADPDVEVRLRAASATVEFRTPRAGDVVIPWLAEGDARLRLAACEVIRASPTERSVVALGRVLGDPDAHVRLSAAAAIGAGGLADGVSPLLGHLDDGSPEVRVEVARALGRIGDPRAVVPLVGKVQDAVPEVRKAVARALGELGDPRSASALMLTLQDASGEVRVEAVTALGRMRAKDATLAIASLLDRADGETAQPGRASAASGEIRAAAFAALGRIGTDAAVKVLVGAVAKEDPAVPRSAAREALVAAGALAHGGDAPAVKALVTLLAGSPSSHAASSGALALGALHARAGVTPIVQAMQRGVLPLRYGLRALGVLGEPVALPTVLELLDDADPAVRREAIAAAIDLLDRGPRGAIDGRAVDPANAALRDPMTPNDEKVELARLLGKTRAPRAQAALLPLVKAKSIPLRIAAIDALGSLGAAAPAVDAALLHALDDDAAEVRLRAARSLGDVGSPAVTSQLLARLNVSAEQDRGAVGVALSAALARASDEAVAEEARVAVRAAPDVARDGIIEGIGRMRGAAAGKALAELASGNVDDRRKVAEALAGHPEDATVARALATDPDAGVRAAAVWSLGAIGGRGDAAPLARALKDVDGAVVGDAAASLGRVASRVGMTASFSEPLCAALVDVRPYVRANALTALAISGGACAGAWGGLGASARDLLARDTSPSVRVAAADALSKIAATDGPPAIVAARALARCAVEDHDASVAVRCSRPAVDPREAAAAPRDDVSIYVVDGGHGAPTPRASFALVRADGLLRLGTADRRGELFEAAAPPGLIHLAVPAALAR
jgi:HEAT repeat protein